MNWYLRYPAPASTGRGGGGGGGGATRAGAVQLPIPAHDIGLRGPHVAPGTFKVTLEVDGVPAGSRTFEVRADPTSAVTPAQHKAREDFVVEVMDLQAKVDALAKELAARRAAATGDQAARLQALEQRLGGAGGGRGGGRGTGAGVVQPVRQRLSGLLSAFTISGATTGTLSAPTGAQRAVLAETKSDLAAIEKEIKSR